MKSKSRLHGDNSTVDEPRREFVAPSLKPFGKLPDVTFDATLSGIPG